MNSFSLACSELNWRRKEVGAQKGLPRCSDSDLTLIGWEGSQGQRSLFTCCSFYPDYLLRLIPSTSNLVSMEGFNISLKGILNCLSVWISLKARRPGVWGRGAKIRFDVLSPLRLFSKKIIAVPQVQSRALGLVWSHLSTGMIKHPALRRPRWSTTMIESAAETYPQTLTSSRSDVFFQCPVWHSLLFLFRIGWRVHSLARFFQQCSPWSCRRTSIATITLTALF